MRLLALLTVACAGYGQVTTMPGSAMLKDTRTYLNNGLTYLDTNKQATIAAGSSGQFFAWDKTWRLVDWANLTGKPSTFAPSAHASSHQNGGSDEVATATAGANAIPKAGGGGTLADAWLSTNVPLKNGTNVFTGTQDAHGAAKTLPHRSGTGSPNARDNCATLGETYFQTDATAGSNSWACTGTGTPGTWTLQGSGGGTSSLTSAHIFVGNVSNVATDVALSGDVSITNAGASTVLKVNGNTPGGTCTNQFARSVDSSGRPTCASIATADLTTAANTRTASVTDVTPATGDSGLILVINPPTAIHLTRAYCSVQGGTNVVVNLDKRAEGTIGTDSGAHLLGSDLTATTSGANTSTFGNGSSQCGGTSTCAIAAHVPVVMTITSISGTVNSLTCSVDYTVD